MEKKEAIKRTGDMLLSGWKMLQDICPICHFALMQKNDELKCPSCNLPVKFAVDCAEEIIDENNVDNVEFNQGDDDGDQSDTPIMSYEEMRREYDQKNRVLKDSSAKLGEKMLQGWTLLGTSCPDPECRGTPLMSRNGDKDMECVSCNTIYIYDQKNNLIEKNSETNVCRNATITNASYMNMNTPLTTNQNNHRNIIESKSESKSSSSVEESIIKSNTSITSLPHKSPVLSKSSTLLSKKDPSDMIGAKLLQGWCMLAEICYSDSCLGNIPLMKNKHGEIQCVVCGSNNMNRNNIDGDSTLSIRSTNTTTSTTNTNTTLIPLNKIELTGRSDMLQTKEYEKKEKKKEDEEEEEDEDEDEDTLFNEKSSDKEFQRILQQTRENRMKDLIQATTANTTTSNTSAANTTTSATTHMNESIPISACTSSSSSSSSPLMIVASYKKTKYEMTPSSTSNLSEFVTTHQHTIQQKITRLIDQLNTTDDVTMIIQLTEVIPKLIILYNSFNTLRS